MGCLNYRVPVCTGRWVGCFLLLKFRVVRCLNYQVYTLHDSSGLPPESCFPEDKLSLKFFPEDKLSLKFFPEDKLSLKF